MLRRADGWHSLRVIDADQARRTRGLAEIAVRVEMGYLPRNSPVFVGTKRMSAPYPDVVVGCPIDEQTAAAVLAGDPSVLADCLEMLEDALEGFMQQVKSGRLN